MFRLMTFIFSALVVGSIAQAATFKYQSNTNELPQVLRTKFEAEFNKRCAHAFVAHAIVQEVKTTKTTIRMDQLMDDYYEIRVEVKTPVDQYIYDSNFITVRASWVAGSNPNPEAFAQIDSVVSDDGLCK